MNTIQNWSKSVGLAFPLDKNSKKSYTKNNIVQTSINTFDDDATLNSAIAYLYADQNNSKTQNFLKNNGFPSAQDRALNKQLYGIAEEQQQMRDLLKSKTNGILSAKLPDENDRAFLTGLMGEKEGERDYQKQISDTNRAKNDLLNAFRGTEFESELKSVMPESDALLEIKHDLDEKYNITNDNGNVTTFEPIKNYDTTKVSEKYKFPLSLSNDAYNGEVIGYTNNSGSKTSSSNSEKVLLRYAVEQAGGTVTWNARTGTADVNIDGNIISYKGDIINGRMVIDPKKLANDFGKEVSEFTTGTQTTFNSAHDAALAFGLIYRQHSDKNKLEYGAIIVSKIVNGKKVYSYKNIVKSKPMLSKEDLTGATEKEIKKAENDYTRRGVSYDWNIEPGEQIEATIHTHWHPNGKLDFSNDDYENQASEVKGMYVVLRTSDFLYSPRTAEGFTEKVHIF